MAKGDKVPSKRNAGGDVENMKGDIEIPKGIDLSATPDFMEGLDAVGGYVFPRWRHKGDTGAFVSSLNEEANDLQVIILYGHPSRVYFKEFKPGATEMSDVIKCRSFDGMRSVDGNVCEGECPFTDTGAPTGECKTGYDIYLFDVKNKNIYCMQLLKTKISPFRRFLSSIHPVKPYMVLAKVTSERKDNYYVPKFTYMKTLSEDQIEKYGRMAMEVKYNLTGEDDSVGESPKSFNKTVSKGVTEAKAISSGKKAAEEEDVEDVEDAEFEPEEELEEEAVGVEVEHGDEDEDFDPDAEAENEVSDASPEEGEEGDDYFDDI